jgi:hypothetical protein
MTSATSSAMWGSCKALIAFIERAPPPKVRGLFCILACQMRRRDFIPLGGRALDYCRSSMLTVRFGLIRRTTSHQFGAHLIDLGGAKTP